MASSTRSGRSNEHLVKAVVEAVHDLQSPSCSADAKQSQLVFLVNSAYKGHVCRAAALGAGAFPAFSALLAHPAPLHVRATAAYALESFASAAFTDATAGDEQLIKQLITHHALPNLVTMLSSSKLLIESAAAALVALVRHDLASMDLEPDVSCDAIMATPGALPKLGKLLTSESALVRYQGATIFTALAAHYPQAVGAAGAMKPLVDLLASPTVSAAGYILDMQVEVLAAINNACQVEAEAVRAAAAGAVQPLLNIITSSRSSEEGIDGAVMAIRGMCLFKCSRAAVVEGDGVEAMVQLLRSCSAAEKSLAHAAEAVGFIGGSSEAGLQEVWEEGAVPALVRTLRRAQHPSLQLHVLLALCRMSGKAAAVDDPGLSTEGASGICISNSGGDRSPAAARVRAGLLAAGVLEPVAALLRGSTHQRSCTAAAQLLINLGVDDSLVQQLVQQQCVLPLLPLLKWPMAQATVAELLAAIAASGAGARCLAVGDGYLRLADVVAAPAQEAAARVHAVQCLAHIVARSGSPEAGAACMACLAGAGAAPAPALLRMLRGAPGEASAAVELLHALAGHQWGARAGAAWAAFWEGGGVAAALEMLCSESSSVGRKHTQQLAEQLLGGRTTTTTTTTRSSSAVLGAAPGGGKMRVVRACPAVTAAVAAALDAGHAASNSG